MFIISFTTPKGLKEYLASCTEIMGVPMSTVHKDGAFVYTEYKQAYCFAKSIHKEDIPNGYWVNIEPL